MNWEQTLVIITTSILTALIAFYLKQGNKKEISKNLNGEYVLRLPKFYYYIGLASITIVVLFIIGSIYIRTNLMYAMTIIMTLLFGGLGIPCFLSFQNHTLSFDKKKIIVTNWKGKSTELKWNEIHYIKFNPLSGYIVIQSKRQKAKINHHLNGLNQFLNFLNKNTKWNSENLKIPKQ